MYQDATRTRFAARPDDLAIGRVLEEEAMSDAEISQSAVGTASDRLPRGRLAPGPRGHVVFGSLPDFRRDILGALFDAWQRHGDVVRFRLGGTIQAYLLVHPDHVAQVLQENHRNYRKDRLSYDRLKPTVGEGLLTSEGDLWLRQRRLIQPAFHRQRIASFGSLMVESTLAMLDRWEARYGDGQTFDVFAEMTRLALEIASKTLFGTSLSEDADRVGQAVSFASLHTNRRMQSYFELPLSLPLPGNRRFRREIRALDEVVYRLIGDRRRAGQRSDDLLSLLVDARDEATGEKMADHQLRDEVMTIMLAGHETTAVALSWTWYLLSRHPAVAARLRAELSDVLGGRPPRVEDLPRLPYTEMVVEEAMRLYPPAWILSRSPIADDVVGGYWIPADKMVMLCPYLTHRHSAFWENPEGFDPERFSPARSAGRPRYAYFPFGGGPRLCIGSGFAVQEARLVLATVAQRVRLDLAPGCSVRPQPLITLRPSSGIRMTMRRAEA